VNRKDLEEKADRPDHDADPAQSLVRHFGTSQQKTRQKGGLVEATRVGRLTGLANKKNRRCFGGHTSQPYILPFIQKRGRCVKGIPQQGAIRGYEAKKPGGASVPESATAQRVDLEQYH